jgi:superoxide reductase
MNRRDAIKLASAVALATAVGAQAEEEYINRMEMTPANPAKLEKAELKHTPKITLGTKDANGYTLVEITVGQDGIIHPSTQDHWIYAIELYADDKLVGKSELSREISRGEASFAVKLDSVKLLKAKAACNLHGIWTSTLSL